MRRILAGGVLLCCLATATVGQHPFRIVTYNTENLFDTLHDAGKNDRVFMPEGEKRWNSYRYWKKLSHLAQTIVASGRKDRLPDVVALSEVENDTVLRDLTRRSLLRSAGYRYVVTRSPDERGIDVALLYQPGSFRLLNTACWRIPSAAEGYRPTRDLLHASGRVLSGDTLHLIVLHLPSKASGTRASEQHRLLAARFIRQKMDSLQRVAARQPMVITGDFNAQASESVFRILLPAEDRKDWQLLPPRAGYHPRLVRGTYNYQGVWNTLDHFIISSSLHPASGRSLVCQTDTALIMDLPFLLEPEVRRGGLKPRRTYLGPRYLGGYSDHLPLCLDLIIRDDKAHCSESSSPGKSVP